MQPVTTIGYEGPTQGVRGVLGRAVAFLRPVLQRLRRKRMPWHSVAGSRRPSVQPWLLLWAPQWSNYKRARPIAWCTAAMSAIPSTDLSFPCAL
jgi:hypothetical protein